MTFIADEAAFDAPAFGIIGSPLFNAPPSLGKMAAGGEWERAEVFVNITQRESRLSPKREPRFSRNRATYIQK